MKNIILSLTFLLCLSIQYMKAQANLALAKSGIPIEMLFPEGKTKALILSYDDGRADDRRLVKLLNDYNLIGTFHLNSNKLGTNDYLTKAEIKDLFKGHEVSVHSANHPNLTTLSKVDIVYEVAEDRKELERLIGIPVRGMAYPFGNNNDVVIDAISGLGIEYARTVDDTYNFSIPKDFLKWHPSIHQFAKAFWEPNNPENDKKELDSFYQLITSFLTTKELALLDVWGHSWEYQTRWEEVDKFFKMVANNKAIYYTTQIALVDYIHAYRNLKFSVDKSVVTNLSAIDIYIKKNNNVYAIKGGSSIILKD
ncbi:polysaccharide deacetylase family protein [Flavobacterium sp. RSB2_4_14]|uniref:polysaccharide deacetylase family protein n=1 Tax=Flavobacterium sp. RSB2_4_14 TaxID=3447665 RepID=UPI003F2D6261